MRVRMRMLLAILTSCASILALSASGSVADLWKRPYASGGVAFDGGGNLFLRGGKFRVSDGFPIWTADGSGFILDAAGNPIGLGVSQVQKNRGTDGVELWSSTIAPGSAPGCDGPVSEDVTTDSAGDVLWAGAVCHEKTFGVVKLSGVDGTELWRYTIEGSTPRTQAKAVAVDASGDVIAAGAVRVFGVSDNFTVVKLRGSNGAELWRFDIANGIPANNEPFAVAVDGNDDAIVVGEIDETGTRFAVLKLSGVDGTELWRYTIEGDGFASSGRAFDLALDGAGNVIAVGTHDVEPGTRIVQPVTVVKLSGVDGAELWHHDAMGTDNKGSSYGWRVALDATGDVVVTARLENKRTGFDFAVFKFDGTNGTEIWRRVLAGPFDKGDVPRGVGVDARGDVVALGFLRRDPPGSADSFALKLDGATGSDSQIAGDQLVIMDRDSDPSRRKLLVKTKDKSNEARTIAAPSPGTPGDPTLGGGFLEIRNPTTGETDSFPLPAANWKGTGNPPGAKGYKYSDGSQAAGPCKRLTLKNAGRLKALCHGSQIQYSLDEPSQGSVAVTLVTGTGGFRNCMFFGGTVVNDTSTSGGGTGLFRAEDAPARGSCAAPSPSSAFLDASSDAFH